MGVESIGVLITKRWLGVHVLRNAVATIALVVILLTGHFGQMALWASAFMAAGEFETFAVAFYHSAVNYSAIFGPLARRYLGGHMGDQYVESTRSEHGDNVLVRMRPERWLTVDFAKDKTAHLTN